MAYGAAEGLSNPLEEYSSYWLKFYVQSTTSPLSMATDAAAGTLLAKAEISAGGTVPIGFIKTAGDAIFIPYLNAAYDAWLFPTEAEADANDTSSAVQIANDVTPEGITLDATIAANTDRVFATVALMVADTTLVSGQFVSFGNYTTSGDGGGNEGVVVTEATGTADGGSYIDLPNTAPALQWEAFEVFSVMQCGASADCDPSTGVGTDDGPAFAAARVAVGETGTIYAPDGNYKITPANRITSTNTSGPLLGRIVGESRGGVLLCGVGFTGTTPVVEFEPTVSSTSDHGCGGLENVTIISAPFVSENPGSGLRLTGAQGGFYRNVAIRGWSTGLWLYNDDNTDHYTEMNDFEHFYIHQCGIDIDFSLELGGSANTSFNGTRMKHMNINAYDGQTMLNFGNFALLYHSQLQLNTFSVTGATTLITANSDSIIRDSVIIDFYNEVASGATAIPQMFISGTATAQWNGVFGQIGNATYIPTVLPDGAFKNTWPSIDITKIRSDVFTSSLGTPSDTAALATINLMDTPANETVGGILTVRAVGGGQTSSAIWTIAAVGGAASRAAITPDSKIDVAGGHAFTLAEVKDGGGTGINRFTLTNDNAAQLTNYDLNFVSFNLLPSFLW